MNLPRIHPNRGTLEASPGHASQGLPTALASCPMGEILEYVDVILSSCSSIFNSGIGLTRLAKLHSRLVFVRQFIFQVPTYVQGDIKSFIFPVVVNI